MLGAEVRHDADQLFPSQYRFEWNLRLLVPRDGDKPRPRTKAMDVVGGIRWAACASGLGAPAEQELSQIA
jgi:hypothetical protein